MKFLSRIGLVIVIMSAPYLPIFDGWRQAVVLFIVWFGVALYTIPQDNY